VFASEATQQGPSRRQEILDAAEAIFAEHGYDRARLEDVARRVGIRRASVLYHFHDKPALYAAVLDSLIEDLSTRYRRVLGQKAPAGVRLEQTVDEWLDVITARPALIRIMLREMADGVSEHSRPFAERALSLLKEVGDVIAAGQADHALRQMSGLHAMMILTGASAFLTLGGAMVSTESRERFPVIADRSQQRALLITIYRKLLGTQGPRSAVETEYSFSPPEGQS
jgi:AcrR family transcriptional regulator